MSLEINKRNLFKIVVVSLMAGFETACGLAEQHKWISEGREHSAGHAREKLREIFAELYDLSFFTPSDENVPLITFDDRKGDDQWGTCVPATARQKIRICAYDIQSEQMAKANDAAFRVSRYYAALLADRKRNVEEIKKIESDLGVKKVADAPYIRERFKEAYIQALDAGIVKEPGISSPTASR